VDRAAKQQNIPDRPGKMVAAWKRFGSHKPYEFRLICLRISTSRSRKWTLTSSVLPHNSHDSVLKMMTRMPSNFRCCRTSDRNIRPQIIIYSEGFMSMVMGTIRHYSLAPNTLAVMTRKDQGIEMSDYGSFDHPGDPSSRKAFSLSDRLNLNLVIFLSSEMFLIHLRKSIPVNPFSHS
jgi:hypothetical protein